MNKTKSISSGTECFTLKEKKIATKRITHVLPCVFSSRMRNNDGMFVMHVRMCVCVCLWSTIKCKLVYSYLRPGWQINLRKESAIWRIRFIGNGTTPDRDILDVAYNVWLRDVETRIADEWLERNGGWMKDKLSCPHVLSFLFLEP